MNKKSIFYGVLGGGLAGGAIYAIKKAIGAANGTNEEPDENDETEYMDADDEQEDADSD